MMKFEKNGANKMASDHVTHVLKTLLSFMRIFLTQIHYLNKTATKNRIRTSDSSFFVTIQISLDF